MDIRHAVGVKAGIPEDKLAALASYKESPHFTEREKAALEYSEQITRDDREVSDECFSRLRQHFSQPDRGSPSETPRAARNRQSRRKRVPGRQPGRPGPELGHGSRSREDRARVRGKRAGRR
ncbi:MAG: hypothetical protein HYY89_01295 [candidate division NC10 bacterium]|nr:hypothetical protein [candidate division NC10 bacterium]